MLNEVVPLFDAIKKCIAFVIGSGQTEFSHAASDIQYPGPFLRCEELYGFFHHVERCPMALGQTLYRRGIQVMKLCIATEPEIHVLRF